MASNTSKTKTKRLNKIKRMKKRRKKNSSCSYMTKSYDKFFKGLRLSLILYLD